MPYQRHDIATNLPVQPLHVLQIIDSLEFGSASIDNARAGRTNFGAASFTSSAHTEFHSYAGNDPMVVYGAASATEVLKVTSAGAVIITGSLIVTGSTTTLIGTLVGVATTASYVENAQTASYVALAQSASYVLNAVSASHATTASYVQNAQTASYVALAQSASYVLNAISASHSATASYVANAQTASYITLAQTASYVNLLAGPGITVDGLAITASVRTVNGIQPTNGNVTVALSATITGTSASLVSSGSGAVTASLADGLVWIVANDPTASNNGDVFIYSSASAGTWYPVAPLDTAASDARYLKLDGGNAPMTGDLDMGGYNLTNVTTMFGTASQAVSASHAVSASWAPTAQSYQIYTALLSTSGGSISTVTVLQNTLGDTITWTVPSNGLLRGTATGTPFTAGKTWTTSGGFNNSGAPYIVTSQPSNAFPTSRIEYNFFLHDGTQSSTPNITNYPVEIRVYP